MKPWSPRAIAALALAALACAGPRSPVPTKAGVDEVARSASLVWNGVAVARDGRVFANVPRFEGKPGPSVVELSRGEPRPFPEGSYNGWRPGDDPKGAFVSTNAIRIGPDGALWALDTGAPGLGKETLEGGPKLVRIDLSRGAVDRVISFPRDVAGPRSHLDDVRFSPTHAYVTDAGAPGLVVIDLASGVAHRVLDHHPSTTADEARPIVIDGEVVATEEGPLFVHADQLELTPDGEHLYFQALGGPLYRVPTRFLDDPTKSAEAAAHVEKWFDTPPLGGTAIDAAGNLYLCVLGERAIHRLSPDRRLEVLVRDPRLDWPDAPAFDRAGDLLVPAAQLDRLALFHHGHTKLELPIRIFRVRVGATID